MRFTDKKILITGGGTGLGKGAAIGFAQEGGVVGIMGRRLEKLEEAAEEIRQTGGTCLILQGDVTKEEEVQNCVDTMLGEAGGIDILINSAGGGGVRDELHEMSDETWYRILEINLTGTFRMCRATIPYFLKKGKGNIINIASVGGMRVRPKAAAYDSAKAAVIMLSKCLAHDYATRLIRCNVISPGVVHTEVNEAFFQRVEGLRDEAVKRQPIGRMGRVEEVTAAILFFADDSAPFITGSVLTVDGGASV